MVSFKLKILPMIRTFSSTLRPGRPSPKALKRILSPSARVVLSRSTFSFVLSLKTASNSFLQRSASSSSVAAATATSTGGVLLSLPDDTTSACIVSLFLTIPSISLTLLQSDVTITVTVSGTATSTPTDAVTVQVGNGATATAAPPAATATSTAGADFGSCSTPQIEFGVGFDGRKETSFQPVDKGEYMAWFRG